MEREKTRLDTEVETLRTFEREYRSRLKSYFTEQLQALDGIGEGGELPEAGDETRAEAAQVGPGRARTSSRTRTLLAPAPDGDGTTGHEGGDDGQDAGHDTGREHRAGRRA